MTTRTGFAAASQMQPLHWGKADIHPTRLRPANPAANHGRKEAVFIDAGLDNAHLVASTTPAGIEVAALSGRQDGLAQLLAWAALAEGYDALHLLCHGAPGRLMLGNGELNATTLDQEEVQDALRAIGLSLRAGGAVFLYGCNTAQGEQGQAFVDTLARALGVPVMAASHVVGASDKGGNWRLDYASAAVSASALAWPDYTETLVIAQEITTFDGLAAGTVDFASTGITFPPNTTITAQNVANTGWDVTAQSSIDGTPMRIRGYNSESINYGDGDSTALRVFANDVDYVIFKANANSFSFDLTRFAFNNTYAAEFTVQAINAAGELTGTAVQFAHAGNSGVLGGAYTPISLAGNPDFVGIYGFKITFTTTDTTDVNSDRHPTGIDAPFFDNIVIANVIAAPPTTTVATVTLSSDTGSNTTDFITRTASQTFSGTLSAPLATGETVQVSFDNGGTWVDATATVGESTWSIAHTLTGSNTFQARVANASGTGTALSKAYVLDTSAPTGLALSQSSTTATAALAGATLATLSATDANAVTYALATGNGSNDIDNGKFTIAGNNLVIGSAALPAATYKVYLAAIDVAGNISYLAQTITVHSVPSVASIVRSNSANAVLPASATSATYTVTFSEAVSGVTEDDFTVTPVGTASGTVSAVTGSGTTYTVTVSGISGDGTLRLDLKSSGTGIQSASTSVPISGGYTAGATYTLDHTAPAASSTPDLAASSDTGNTTDNITADNTPTFTGTAEAGAVVTLYEGTTVLGSITATGGTWSITAPPLSDGAHTVTAKVTDAAGNVSAASEPLTVHIDTAAPTSLALSTTTTAVSSATANATVATLSAVDANTITYTLVTSGGNGAHNDKFVIDGNTLKVAGAALVAGDYSIQIKATDVAGNAVIKTQTITVQNAPSVVSIVRSNSADEVLPASATSATYTVTFSEAVNGVTADDFTLTPNGTASGTVSAVSGSGTTYTVTVSGIIGNGTLRLDLKSSGTGIESTSTSAPISGGYTAGATYTVDHTAPAVSSTPDLTAASDTGNTTDNITADNTPTFTGTAEAGATVTLYDTDGITVLGSTTATGGAWVITSSPLADGEHQVSAKVTDKAGNVSAASAPLTVHIDTASPTNVVLDTPSIATSNAIAGATVTSLSADDANAISYALVSGNGNNDSENYLFVIVGNTLKVGASPLSAGTYHIYLRATDTAGNTTQVAKTITVANAPVVSSIVRADAAGSILPASENSAIFTVTFSQAVSDVDASDFELSGAASGTISGISGSGTTYTVTVTGISGDGALRLDLKASGTGIKNADNIVIAGGYTGGESYTIDRTAPSAPAAPVLASASNTGDTTDTITANTTPHLSGTAEIGATVTLYDTDGTTVLGTTTATDGTWSITSSALTDSAHTLTVKATDAAGNVSGASQPLTLTIDTTAPTSIALSTTGVATASAIPGASVATLSAVDANSVSYALASGDGSNDAHNGSFLIDGTVLKVAGTALAAGTYNIYVQATDIAGNTGYLARTITVADAPAVASIVRANGAGELLPASAGTAIYTVTFSQAVTGVDASDFVLSGTASGTIGSVTGSGATYTVTVTGISGEGALRLDLRASSTGIKNGAHIDIGSGYTGGASYTVEPPPPVTPPVTPAPDIDGMPVTQEAVTLPGGGSGTQIVVPVVPPGRSDTSGNPSVADIPLAIENGNTALLAQLPIGYGLTSRGGASQPAGSAGNTLIAAIQAVTPSHQPGDQGHLTGNGSQFLQGLQGTASLLVHTVVPVTAPSGATGPLTLTGTSTANQHTALVIDGSQLPAGAGIDLNSVDFAALIGAVNVRGNTSGQFLSGDGAAQTFNVGNGLGSQVFAGAGNDTLGIQSAGASAGTLGASSTLLHGGLDSDTAVFNGVRADYDIRQYEGYLVVSHKSQPEQKVLLVNVESLKFDDVTIAVQYSDSLAVIAGLYSDVLGRQADYAGIDYWASLYKSGAGLGAIALGILGSAEGRASQGGFNGDTMHDLQLLYTAILGRPGDAQGLAYWTEGMAQGVTLEQVADALMQSSEGAQHLIGVTQWNFFV